jgi:hypothetical protein
MVQSPSKAQPSPLSSASHLPTHLSSASSLLCFCLASGWRQHRLLLITLSPIFPN